MADEIKSQIFFGGSNQIARLPYKTIDALQKLGLYVAYDEDADSYTIRSECQDLSENYTVKFGINIDSEDIESSNLYISGENIYNIFSQIIKINKPIATNNTILNTNERNLLRSAKVGDIIVGNDNSIVIVTKPIDINFQSPDGILFQYDQSYSSMQSMGLWHYTGSKISITQLSYPKQKYLSNFKIVSTAGDTCYLSCVSGAQGGTNLTRVKYSLIGGLKTAEGTGINALEGVYACTGYNTNGKVIVGFDLKENKFIYTDGTMSDVLTTSNTTVTYNSYGIN